MAQTLHYVDNPSYDPPDIDPSNNQQPKSDPNIDPSNNQRPISGQGNNQPNNPFTSEKRILEHMGKHKILYILMFVFLMLANLTTTIFIILYSLGIYECETTLSGLAPLQTCPYHDGSPAITTAGGDKSNDVDCKNLAWYYPLGKKTCINK